MFLFFSNKDEIITFSHILPYFPNTNIVINRIKRKVTDEMIEIYIYIDYILVFASYLISDNLIPENRTSPANPANIRKTCVQRRPSVFDVGPTLYKCYTNVLCLLVCHSPLSSYRREPVFVLHPAPPGDLDLCTYLLGFAATCWMLKIYINKTNI